MVGAWASGKRKWFGGGMCWVGSCENSFPFELPVAHELPNKNATLIGPSHTFLRANISSKTTASKVVCEIPLQHFLKVRFADSSAQLA